MVQHGAHPQTQGYREWTAFTGSPPSHHRCRAHTSHLSARLKSEYASGGKAFQGRARLFHSKSFSRHSNYPRPISRISTLIPLSFNVCFTRSVQPYFGLTLCLLPLISAFKTIFPQCPTTILFTCQNHLRTSVSH